jgi:hypothetical protein
MNSTEGRHTVLPIVEKQKNRMKIIIVEYLAVPTYRLLKHPVVYINCNPVNYEQA